MAQPGLPKRCTLRLLARSAVLLSCVPLCLILGTSACRRHKVCKPAQASKLGYRDAGRNTPRGLDRARECRKGKYRAEDFRRDYWRGWYDYVDDTCVGEVVAQLGREDGLRGDLSRGALDELAVCLEDPKALPKGESAAGIEKAYNEAFVRALCTTQTVRAVAQRRIQGLSAEHIRWAELCPASVAPALQAEYDGIIQAERDRLCSARGLYGFGARDARDGRPVEEGLNRLEHCPREREAGLMHAYREGYRDQQDAQRAEQRRQDRRELIEAVARSGRRGGRRGDRTLVRDGKELYLSCRMDGNWAVVELYNPGDWNVSFSATWDVTFYDGEGRVVGSKTTRRHVSVWGNKTESFKIMGPLRSESCDVDA